MEWVSFFPDLVLVWLFGVDDNADCAIRYVDSWDALEESLDELEKQKVLPSIQ